LAVHIAMARRNTLPRHAWWRGRGLTWRRPEALTADVAGLYRATDLGAAVSRPDPWRGWT